MVDAAQGVLGIEWIDGRSVRFLLGGGEEDEAAVEESDDVEDETTETAEEDDPLAEYGVTAGARRACRHVHSSTDCGTDAVMQMVGTEIAKMHLADIIHGDLTTSNMMLRRPTSAAKASLVWTVSPSVIRRSHPSCRS